jgi:hypothetical protein
LTRPSSSSAAMDRDVDWEDNPSARSSTMSQTHTTEVCGGSSSASVTRCAASSTPSYPVASSRWLASQARPDGGPRSRPQILTPGRSSHERHSSTFRNSATTLSTTSTRKVSSGECPSMNSTTEDTIVRIATRSMAISMWQRVAIRIPSDR